MGLAYARLGAAETTAPILDVTARQFESAAKRAQKAVAYNVLFRRALPRSVAAMLDAGVGPAASPRALVLAQVIAEAEQGRVVLQPYTVGTSSEVRWGFRRSGASLGWWPIAVQVLKYATQAALAAGGFVVFDGWNEVNAVEAEAHLVKAKTDAALQTAVADLQQVDPARAADLLGMVVKARAEADTKSDSMSWLETAGTAAIGIGTGALLVAGGLWLYSRRKKGGRR
jgi:hypothetical protein